MLHLRMLWIMKQKGEKNQLENKQINKARMKNEIEGRENGKTVLLRDG